MVINFNVRSGANQDHQEAGRDCSLYAQEYTQDHCRGSQLSTVSQLACRWLRRGSRRRCGSTIGTVGCPVMKPTIPAIPLGSFYHGRPHDQQQAFGKLYGRTTQGRPQGTQLEVRAGDTDLASRGMPSECYMNVNVCTYVRTPAPLPEQQTLNRIRNPTLGGLRRRGLLFYWDANILAFREGGKSGSRGGVWQRAWGW